MRGSVDGEDVGLEPGLQETQMGQDFQWLGLYASLQYHPINQRWHKALLQPLRTSHRLQHSSAAPICATHPGAALLRCRRWLDLERLYQR